jgi:hypothetical protein
MPNFNTQQIRWLEDEKVLAEIGNHLQFVNRDIEVHIPITLAKSAISAWNRNDTGGSESIDNETCKQRTIRHRAGSLALIGLALSLRGCNRNAGTSILLDSWLIAHALDAADDHNLISPTNPSTKQPSIAILQPRFINVDLELTSTTALPLLEAYFQNNGIVLHSSPEKTLYRLVFELAENTTQINAMILRMIEIIDGMPEIERLEWEQSTTRVFDIGIESGDCKHQPVFNISQDVIEAIARVGAAIAVTLYPHYSNTEKPSRFTHINIG